MAPISRRRILQCVPPILIGISGCTEQTYSARDTPESSTPTSDMQTPEFPNSTTTAATKKVRTSDGSPAIRSSSFTPKSEWETEEWLVGSVDERNTLQFSESASGVKEAKTFLGDIDFSNETVLIVQYPVNKCRTQELELLKWGPANEGPSGYTSFWLKFSVVERKTTCEETSKKDIEATLIQVPDDVERIYRITRKGSHSGQ